MLHISKLNIFLYIKYYNSQDLIPIWHLIAIKYNCTFNNNYLVNIVYT